MKTKRELKEELKDLISNLKQHRDKDEEDREDYNERMIMLRAEICQLEWILE